MPHTNTSILELVIAAAGDDPRVPAELDAIDDWEEFGRRAFDLLVLNQQINQPEPAQDSTHRATFWAVAKTITDSDDLDLTAQTVATLDKNEHDRLLFTCLSLIRIYRTAPTRADAAATWQQLIRDENNRTGIEPTE
ncbi:hypothetical protein ACFRFH_09550 [Leifsonia sp. NPDC056824]|uniref:hypothetical protein n=1 Tax=Leifsonia sp. NPDC056824 TaxID=3345953 RepID=UPI0036B64677